MLETDRPLELAFERLADIRETELGQTLLDRPRYGHFRPPDMTITEWLDLFDDDINNFEHNGLTAYLADIVTQIDEVSPEIRAAVILTASIHDLPEDITGTTSGDKQYNLSGREEERLERARLRQLALDPDFPLKTEEVELSIDIMNDSKRTPPKTEAGFFFNVVERVGYLRTAFIAWDLLETNQVQAHQRVNLQWMIGNILGNHLEYMDSIRDKSAAVNTQLQDNHQKLTRMTEMLDCASLVGDIWVLCTTTRPNGVPLDGDKEIDRIGSAVRYWTTRS